MKNLIYCYISILKISRLSILSKKLPTDLGIGEGTSGDPPSDALFIILQIMKNRTNRQATRHHAGNCINNVHSYNFLGEEVEGIILTLHPHEQTDSDYEHKEACLTAHSIFIYSF
jgi:hypothetical protein